MKEKPLIVVGAPGLASAIAEAMQDRPEVVRDVIVIEQPIPEPIQEPLLRERPRRDWEQRQYRRPKRRHR